MELSKRIDGLSDMIEMIRNRKDRFLELKKIEHGLSFIENVESFDRGEFKKLQIQKSGFDIASRVIEMILDDIEQNN